MNFKGTDKNKVKSLFSRIAFRYDLLNNLISVGLHTFIRRKAIKEIKIKSNVKILDCATGTGSMLIEFNKYTKGNCILVGLDFSEEMIQIAEEKLKRKGIIAELIIGDCHSIPFPSNSFDVISIAWGIRNVENPIIVLGEMVRVAKGGGQILIIESGKPHGLLKFIYLIWCYIFIPILGLIFVGDYKAYLYYYKSINSFYKGEEFKNIMEGTGWFEFVNLRYAIPGLCWYILARVKNKGN